MEEFSVVFKGFKTKEQSESFIEWYNNSGEEYFTAYLDLINDDTTPCYVNVEKTYPLKPVNNIYIVELIN